jgi:hypothetical protein
MRKTTASAVLHNYAQPNKVVHVKPREPLKPMYDFDSLRHGDALKVINPASAQEMFRRWKKRHCRRERLVLLPNGLLLFTDDYHDDIV